MLGIIPGVLFLKSRPYKPENQKLPEEQKDEELIALYKKTQDNRLIGILFDRYIHLVYASCMKYFKDAEDAQDAAMEIFEDLPEKLLKHEIEYFKGWLYTTSRNHCLMSIRKTKPVDRMEKIENFSQLSVENESILHLDNAGEENNELVIKCLAELKHEQKVCVELMYLKGKSYKDIADETGFGLKNVKSFIQNGKRNLRLMMEQYNEKRRYI